MLKKLSHFLVPFGNLICNVPQSSNTIRIWASLTDTPLQFGHVRDYRLRGCTTDSHSVAQVSGFIALFAEKNYIPSIRLFILNMVFGIQTAKFILIE